MTSLRAGSATDVGRVRTVNQDRLLVADGLWAVADGMGGHAGGEVAARLAIEALDRQALPVTGTDGLVSAIRAANQAVWERARAEVDLRGMGTTVTAVALVGASADGTGAGGPAEELVVANVGDSRAYLFQRGELSQLTADHSLVEEMVRAGELSEDEAAGHPHRHILTRALGIDPDVEVDSWVLSPHEGDRLLLCSDGLVNEVDDGRISDVLRSEPDPQVAADRLVEMARAHGGADNITVIILDVVEDAGAGAGASGADDATVLGAPAPGEAGPGASLAGPAPDAGRPDATAAVPVVDSGGAGGPMPLITSTPPRDPGAAARPSPGAGAPVLSYGGRQRRVTVRVVAFVLALLAVIGGAIAAVVWYARGSYYVGLQGNQVVIFQGRPGGVLWMKPTLAQHTDVTTAELTQEDRQNVQGGVTEPSLQAALDYVRNTLIPDYQASTPAAPPTTAPAPGTTVPVTTTTAGGKP